MTKNLYEFTVHMRQANGTVAATVLEATDFGHAETEALHDLEGEPVKIERGELTGHIE